MTQRSASPPLIGREADLAALTTILTEALGGTLKVALVEGEPGIGKSRLVAEAIHAHTRRARVLVGQGHELERERPFGVIADALDLDRPFSASAAGGPERAALASLLRGDASTADAEFAAQRFQIIEAMLDLLTRWAAEQPLLVILEDLHWADPSSLLVVDQFARRLAELPIAIVGTMRPSPRSVTVEQLRRGLSPEDSVHLRLSPLDDDAVGELTTALIGAAPGPDLRQLVGGAAGNPFFVTELVAALSDSGRVVAVDHQVELTEPGVLPTLRATILHRLGFLPPACLELLGIAAVIGSRFRLDDLSVVLDAPASQLATILDDATRSGLLVASGHDLVFRHHLVWDAVYHDLPLASREALHLQVARRFVDTDRPADKVATHFLAGASPGDQQAVGWLERAAQEAISRAPDVAAELLRGALHLADGVQATHDRLAVDLATALTWAARLGEAEALLQELATRPHGAEVDVNIWLGLARILIIQGKAAAARPYYEQLKESPALIGARRARVYADESTACLLTGDVSAARLAAEAALAEGREADDDPAICGGLCASGWVATIEGRTAEALDLAEQAVALAQRSANWETGRRYPHVFLAIVLMDADRLDDGQRMFDTGRRMAEAFGDVWQLPIHHLGTALAAFHAGAYDDAVAALATADEVVEESGTRVLGVWSSSLGARIAIERDELTEANRLLTLAERQVAETGPGFGVDWLLWGRSLLLEAEGDVPAAADLLQNAWDLAASLGIVAQRRLIGPDLVRLLLAVDDVDTAKSIAAALMEAADLGGVPSVRAAAERCFGLVERDPDRVLAAADLARSCPQRLEYARTCEDAGRVLAVAGRAAEATSLLQHAADQYRTSGARRGERRVDASLRALGVVRGRRERRSRPAIGWEALTPTELEVSNLASAGLTNPEIGRRMYISPRTVETHLSRVYGKLGVSSRVELATAAVERAR